MATTPRKSCVCGLVQWDAPEADAFFQCHCFLCSSTNIGGKASVVPANQFRWLSGAEAVVNASTSSSFCEACGASCPKKLGDLPFVWLPFVSVDNSFHPMGRLCVYNPPISMGSVIEDFGSLTL